MTLPILKTKEGSSLSIKVQAGSKKGDSLKQDQNQIKVFLKAKPHQNKANEALLNFLSLSLCIPKKDLVIKKGLHHSLKVISIQNCSPESLQEKISFLTSKS